MNHFTSSPFVQTNETAGKYSPAQQVDGGGDHQELSTTTNRRLSSGNKYLLGEELTKISRRSNHSSHHARTEIMDDDEHDAFIKGLWYPGLQEEDYDEFYDDSNESMEMEYAIANTAASSSAATAAGGGGIMADTPRRQDSTHAPFHNSQNFGQASNSYSQIQERLQQDNSNETTPGWNSNYSHYASLLRNQYQGPSIDKFR
jgi:hypothetical protein